MDSTKVKTFGEYQSQAIKVRSSLRNNRDRVDFPAIGLQQEAGRVGAMLSKALVSGKLDLTPKLAKELKEGCSEILWYLALICDETKITLQEVAEHSVAQLEERSKEIDSDQR